MRLIATVIRKRNGLRVQEQSLQAEFSGNGVGLRIPVAFIPRHRVAQMQGMYTNLVRASRQWLALEQAVFAEGPGQAQLRLCRFSGPAHDHVPFPIFAMLDQQRRVDELVTELPIADHQRQIVLADPSVAKFLLQFPQRAPPLGPAPPTAR